MPYAKNHIRVNVPKRSGFDKTHRNSGTGLCGTLLPLLCDEVIPNSRISLRLNLATQLPPLVSDTYMNVKQKVEAFFVPGRLLCKSYEDWFCDHNSRVLHVASGTSSQSAGSFYDVVPAIPCVSADVSTGMFNSGSLADYLGLGIANYSGSVTMNLLPFIAYHLIWQEYYRNPRIQSPAFVHDYGTEISDLPVNYPRIAAVTDQYFRYAGGTYAQDNYAFFFDNTNASDFLCADGTSIFGLRQRNFGIDYFTGSRPSPQLGDAAGVTLAIPAGTDAAGGSTSFTIAQLRAANSLQQFRERNGLPGTRLVEQVKARYGANLSDGVAQRPICIGSCTYDYNSVGVNENSQNTELQPKNPFAGVGSQRGRAYSAGSDFIIDDFVANEPGYIFVLQSQVPEVTYASGIDRVLTRYIGPGSIVEMANPLLQNVGDQPILDEEIVTRPGSTPFGYQDRFADFMYKRNQSHGLFRTSSTLSHFVLQRTVAPGSTLNDAFLKIPTGYLDSVLEVTSVLSGISYWYDAMLDYKVSMPLAEFSIPSLQDPAYEHGQSVNIRRNGQIF